jgi:hypothetical protein
VELPLGLAEQHQQLSQLVLALPVAAVGPELVLVGVLHQLGLSRPNQPQIQLVVVVKLHCNSLPHYSYLHGFPVGPYRNIGCAAQSKGFSGRLSGDDNALHLPAFKLSGLVEVLDRRVVLVSMVEGRRVEIAEEAIVALGTIEFNDLRLILFGNDLVLFHNKRIIKLAHS